MTAYIVELEPGVWLDVGDGDPARTLVKENAKLFSSEFGAIFGMEKARDYRPFKAAKVVAVEI